MRIMALNQMPRNTKDPDYHVRIERLLRGHASPGTEVDLSYPDDYPGAGVSAAMSAQDVHTELHYVISLPSLIRKIVSAEEQGYNAVVQTNAFDPGVEPARLAVRIPVIGLCRTAVMVAESIAERIAITVPFDGYVSRTWHLLQSYGLERRVTDVRSLQLSGIPRGAEVDAQRAELRAQAVDLMRSLVKDTRAQCIVPLGAAIVPYIVSPADLEQAVGVPVMNTTAIGIRFAELCVSLGITHSAQTYPTARLTTAHFDALAYPGARA